MKKKLFLGALLLGALTLNSCVDNVESDSVKAVRQAKAEQLKAKADLDKATGEATLINANAEKAAKEIAAKAKEAEAEYIKAQAEYQRALAEYQKAQAAYWNAQAETEKARAAEALAKAELAAQEAQITLEEHQAKLAAYKKEMASLEAKWEKQLYEYQKLALEAQRELEKFIKEGDQVKISELEDLLDSYATASENLIKAQKKLVNKQLLLAKYEAGFITSNEGAIENLATKNEEKNYFQIDLDAYEAALETFEKNYNYEAAKEALITARQELADLKIAQAKALVAKDDAAAVAANADFALTSSKYADAVKYITDLVTSGGVVFSGYSNLEVTDVTNPAVGIGNVGNYCAKITDNSQSPAVVTYIPLFSDKCTPEYKDLKYQNYGSGTSTMVSYYKEYSEYYNLVDGGMPQFVDAVKDFVKNNQEKELADATKDVTDQTAIVNPIKALCDNLEPLGKAYNDAVTAESDAIGEGLTGDDLTPYTTKVTEAKEAFEAAVKDQKLVAPNYLPTISLPNPQKLDDYLTANSITATVNLCKRAYSNEKSKLDRLVSMENTKKYVLTAAEKTVAEIETIAKTLVDGNKDNLAAIAEVNKTQLAKAETYLEYVKANNNVAVKNAEITAINATVTGTTTVVINGTPVTYTAEGLQNQIKITTKSIADKQAEIDKLENDIEAGKLDDKSIIDKLKLDIAELEVEIPVLQKAVDMYKELLDAAMKSVEPEETPAE